MLVNSATLRDKDGNPTMAVLAFQDISPLKQVEEQLRQSQKMEAIGRLAGGIAHDFNNLLSVIIGYSSMTLTNMEASHPLYNYLREILTAGERAASLTKQLLVYSRKQILEPKLWNLNTIVFEMSGMLKRLIGEDISLTTVLSPHAERIKADRGQIEQIIVNLVVNSRDAMPHGGRLEVQSGTVFLDKAHPGLDPNTIPGPYVMLRVSDTGMGMVPTVMARIFEPFFTTKDVSKGTGLGLSVVYGIVKESGAQINVTSELSKGTTFRIYFPVADETILLVEDEESVRKLVSRALESLGYKVLQAGNGREALDTIGSGQHAPIDLVVTDVVMPEMGGREFVDRLRALLPGLPVVFLSGYLNEAILRTGINEWEESFLQKPFNPFQLAVKVRESLDASAARKGK
jgi:nitrogen-specific signal transduction histidine kinase